MFEIIGRIVRNALIVIGMIAVVSLAVRADYTEPASLNFGSVVISGVNYAKRVICDAVAPQTYCGAVKAGNTAVMGDVAQVVADPNVVAAIATPPNCLVAANSNTNSYSAGAMAPFNCTVNGALYVAKGSAYPAGSAPVAASAAGTTGVTTATLPAASGTYTHLCWISIRVNAAAPTTGNATITGTVGGPLNFTQWTAPNSSGLGINEQIFNPCLPGSAVNTALAITSAAPGTGGVVSVSAGGYQNAVQ